ncbi:MAG: hypothetical protein EKK49_08970 [Rhodocyclaceae bacterium]|nr:MAG: hypothetical protein EKK49_08970 [Rhodocyclaceae bacterium]
MSANLTRRRFIRLSVACATCVPLVSLTGEATAATNQTLRAQYKYQDSPLDGKNCTSCLEFIPGSSATAPGRCKLIPGDDEISPNGYCTLWNTM